MEKQDILHLLIIIIIQKGEEMCGWNIKINISKKYDELTILNIK